MHEHAINLFQYLTLFIAVVGLLLSCWNFYFNQLRPPTLSISLGSKAVLGTNPNGTSIFIPTTFTNEANKPGKITDAHLLVTQSGADHEGHLIRWDSFRKLNNSTPGTTWVQESLAYPLSVMGKSAISKTIQFDWTIDNSIFTQAGVYQLEIFATQGHTSKKIHTSCKVTINQETLKTLLAPTQQPPQRINRIAYIDLTPDSPLNRKISRKDALKILEKS
ncbi:hypothetical protein [Halodesulfovibrio marinisediminis]|uniref:Uncharacterized protein n=1 Tax=Halodesulfovibrio marinisediminis DSM 17456 TaxID=1121457 RepID=A0A1N6F8N8_9BACT|nr:hypothetical protein [Halodesulfovibrio marinisediminis]SIN91641.1 hypothetical protein SAMN02745161_1169 [Halodesulfovibrio marinisediminis DSM 17456]